MIPRIIHYVWVGPSPMPAKDADFVEGWKRLMPSWEFCFWNESTICFEGSRWLQAAYAMQGWNRIADYIRVWSIKTYGGIYLDTDIELLKPLDAFLSHDAFIGYQMDHRHRDRPGSGEWVNSAVIGSVPGHWFPTEALSTLVSRHGGWKDQGAWTGPGLATEVLCRHGLEPPGEVPVDVKGVAVYPRRWFYPYHWSEQLTDAEITSDTVAIHHWAGTWTNEAKRWPLGKKILMRLTRVAPRLSYLMRKRTMSRLKPRSGLQAAPMPECSTAD